MEKKFILVEETAEIVKEKMFAVIDAMAIPRKRVLGTPKLASFVKGNATHYVWTMPFKSENGYRLNVIYYFEVSEDFITVEAGKINFVLLPVGRQYEFGMVGVRYNQFGNLENVLYRRGEEKFTEQALSYYGLEADGDYFTASGKAAAV